MIDWVHHLLTRWGRHCVRQDGMGYPQSPIGREYVPDTGWVWANHTVGQITAQDVADCDAAVRQMPSRTVAILFARYGLGLSLRAIAAQCESSKSAVASEIDRAHVEIGQRLSS